VFAQNASETDKSAQTMAYENPQLYYIAEINVKGAENLNEDIIITLSGLEVRERIQLPGPEIRKAIHRIWAQQIVEDITIKATKFEKDRVWLQISIKELPRLVSMDLKGVKKTQEKELASRINFVRGKTLKVADYTRIRSVIQKYFGEKGYLDIEVNIEKKKDQFLENHVHLTANINPGHKVKVSGISFEGNQVISAGRLKKQFENTHEKSIFNIFRPSTYIPSNLEKDKQLVLNFYRSKGFMDAEFTDEQIIKKGDGDVQINLQVEEGKPYYIRNITWTGNYVYNEETLQKVLDVKKGELYNPKKVQENLYFNPQKAALLHRWVRVPVPVQSPGPRPGFPCV
jgi:outer membrane protein insertion porin family